MKQVLVIVAAIVVLSGYSLARPRLAADRQMAEYQRFYVRMSYQITGRRFSVCNQLYRRYPLSSVPRHRQLNFILCTRGDGTHFYRLGTYWPRGAATVFNVSDPIIPARKQ